MEEKIKFDAMLTYEPDGEVPNQPCIAIWVPQSHFHKVHDQIKWNQSGVHGFSVGKYPVTLSPVGQEPKPDYEAMWGDMEGFIGPKGKGMITLRSVKRQMELIRAKHTPKPEKPEGQDNEAPT